MAQVPGKIHLVSAQLSTLEGRISDADFDAWADLEQRRLLNRTALDRLGHRSEGRQPVSDAQLRVI